MKFSIKDFLIICDQCECESPTTTQICFSRWIFIKYKRQVFIVEIYGIGSYSNSWTVGA